MVLSSSCVCERFLLDTEMTLSGLPLLDVAGRQGSGRNETPGTACGQLPPHLLAAGAGGGWTSPPDGCSAVLLAGRLEGRRCSESPKEKILVNILCVQG